MGQPQNRKNAMIMMGQIVLRQQGMCWCGSQKNTMIFMVYMMGQIVAVGGAIGKAGWRFVGDVESARGGSGGGGARRKGQENTNDLPLLNSISKSSGPHV